MKTIHAIFENGVFRPLKKVDLPESTEVEFEPRLVDPDSAEGHRRRAYEILSDPHDTGDPTLAERHAEHQP